MLGTYSEKESKRGKVSFDFVEAWELIRTEYPDGKVDTFDVETYTRYTFFNAESIYCSIDLFANTG